MARKSQDIDDLRDPDARARPNFDGGQHATQSSIVRWGCYSISLNLALILLHAAIAFLSGSLAVTAELLHNFSDLATAIVLVIGLKIAQRRSRSFPYGLYKVENLVAAGISIAIFFTAYEIVTNVIVEDARPPKVDVWMLFSLMISMALPLVFSHFEMRVARRTNSPALKANAQEYRIHVYTTGLAFISLLAGSLDVPIDGLAAVFIVLVVVKAGWSLLADAMRVLLDASLDGKTLDELKHIIESDTSVMEVNWVTGRNAGRFRFVEAGVAIREHSLKRPEDIVARIEATVRTAIPQIERVLLHIEPQSSDFLRYAIPVADISGTICEHFGEAPFFAILKVSRRDGTIAEQSFRANPYRTEKRAKGLRVAEWLVVEKIDRVVLPQSIEGKGPDYVFREAGISVEISGDPTVSAFLGNRENRP